MRQKPILTGVDSIAGMGLAFLPVVVLLTLISEGSRNECLICHCKMPHNTASDPGIHLLVKLGSMCMDPLDPLDKPHTYYLVYIYVEMAKGELRNDSL